MSDRKQTILVTGATSGIGRHAALYLAKRGHRVFASGRNQAANMAVIWTKNCSSQAVPSCSRRS